MTRVQNYPTVDSVPTDAFESLVEAYYQINGYITSSNKWFWVFKSGKKQRGYQDIDVLAINVNETLIIDVTGNLDDKIRRTRNGQISEKMLTKLNQYFERVETYLRSVRQYSWMVDGSRRVRKIVAYASGRLNNDVSTFASKHDIEFLSGLDVLRELRDNIIEFRKAGLRTNNQMVEVFKLLHRENRRTC